MYVSATMMMVMMIMIMMVNHSLSTNTIDSLWDGLIHRYDCLSILL